MKPLLCAFILVLLSSCSTVPRTTSSPAMGVTQVKKPPFTIIELSLIPWAAVREEGGNGLPLRAYLVRALRILG